MTQQLSITDALQAAVSLHQSGQLQQAEQLYRAILQLQANHPDANHNLGILAMQVGHIDSSIPLFKAAVEANPRNIQFWSSLIDALLKSDNIDGARNVLEQGKVQWIDETTSRQLEQKINATTSKNPREIATYYFTKGNTLFNQGNIADALAQYDTAIQKDPHFAEAYNNRSTALKRLGRFEEALASSNTALSIAPENADAHLTKGNILKDLNRLDEALQCYDNALRYKQLPAAYTNKSVILMDLGRYDDAQACCDAALRINPDYVEATINKGCIARNCGRLDEALTLFDNALRLAPQAALAHNNKGSVLRDLERFEEALACYDTALAIAPLWAEALNNKGIVLYDLGRHTEALAVYETVLEHNPGNSDALCNKARAFCELACFDAAIEAYEEALRINPEHIAALANLCLIYEKTNRLDALKRRLSEAPSAARKAPNFIVAKARLLKRDGDLATAAALLREALAGGEVPDQCVRSEFFYELGTVLDRQGNHAEAFAAFQEKSRITETLFDKQHIDRSCYLTLVERLRQCCTAAWGTPQGADDPETACPVFLVGFPRSGTTLLDTILRSHHDTVVVEEKPMVERMLQAIQGMGGGYPDAIAGLDTQHVIRLRDTYWQELSAHINTADDAGKRIIDKFPLNILHIGLIHTVFPNAKYILALRHPCDCVLSCFMHTFQPNAAMANFLSLEDAARFYDRTMDLWEHYRRVLPLDVHPIRYEDVVSDFDTTVGNLLQFLDLPWTDAVSRFYETARKRKQINTPSYSQVVRPLYKDAKGRWERYREALAPTLPTLLPWAERFGYGTTFGE